MISKYLLSSLICLSFFCGLALLIAPQSIVYNHVLSQADNSMFLIIVNSHYEAINQLMIYFTMYGREAFWILVISLFFILGKRKGRKIAALTILVIVILVPIGMFAKQVTERPRPMIPDSAFLMAPDSEYAFPSGHALMVSAGAAVSIALLRNSYKELAISSLLTVEAGLVCFSRVYVGGHYPLDVLGGILLGVGVAYLCVWRQNDLEKLYHITDRSLRETIKR